MKIFAALLALLMAEEAVGFLPTIHRPAVQHARQPLSAMGMAADTDTDVSIPYDAAARLSYDKWRAEYNKGDFDAARYETFKKNYETITVANVSAKKKAREEGTVSLSLLTLNEFGDMSEEEFLQKQKGSPKLDVASTGDVLSMAVENAELQSMASNALVEAADALAEEERKLVEKLGLRSVEELEIALDSLEGIAPDGGELETDNIAREARVREAYLNWCKEYGKEPDESRFPTFSNNFLMMEQYAKQSAKEMNLNQYADWTKEEFEAMQAGSGDAKVSVPKAASTAPAKTPLASKSEPSAFEKALEAAAKAALGATEKAIEATGKAIEFTEKATKNIEKAAQNIEIFDPDANEDETAEERAARLKAKAEAIALAEKEAAEARVTRMKEQAERAEKEAERRKEIEKERAEREKALAVAAEKAKAQAEADAIASAKAAAEKEATLAAQRAYFEKEAAALTRKKAAEEEAKLKNLNKARQPAPKQQKQLFSFFAAPQKEAPKKTSPKIELELNLGAFNSRAPKAKKEEKNPIASLFSPKSEPQNVAKPVSKMPQPLQKAPAAKKTSTPVFSFFSPAPKPAPKIKISPAPAPAPSSVSKKKDVPVFSFFSAPSPKPKPRPASAPAPAPASKKPAATAFSFFSPPAPKPKAVAAPAQALAVKKAPAPVVKKAPAPAKSFSLFGPPPPKREPAPSPVPAAKAKPSPSFTLFGPPPAKKKSVPRQDVKVPNRGGTINLFGSQSIQPKKVPPAKRDIAVPNRVGTISLGAKKETPASKPVFSFFGGGGASAPPKAGGPPAGVPVLSNWKQNPNGSITGNVSKATGFRNGTEITTSPVKKGALKGTVVTTGSGSKYYLS